MDLAEESRLDTEFDQMLVEMKPHVLRLPHKSERQRCALWIKKFCEPPAPGVTGRRNRNLYAKLLVHMLRKGLLEGPFTDKPHSGPLPALPSYMSIYFDESKSSLSQTSQQNLVPDWVAGELGSEMTGFSSINPLDSPDSPEDRFRATEDRFQAAQDRFQAASQETTDLFPKQYASQGTADLFPKQKTYYPRARSPSPPRSRSLERNALRQQPYDQKDDLDFLRAPTPTPSEDPIMLDLPAPPSDYKYPTPLPQSYRGQHRTDNSFFSRYIQPSKSYTSSIGVNSYKYDKKDWQHNDTNYSTFLTTTAGTSLFKDDSTLPRGQEREVEMRTKMLEAKFQEDKLRLQQKHDSTVQKILNRKNTEIEELKNHYRNKTKEHEDQSAKLEKKLSQLQKELTATKEAREQEVSDLKAVLEETTSSRQMELDKKISDLQASFEEEKFTLQKQHTKNIQELLDDTNARLTKMEAEYSQQMQATTAVIRELEGRVQQLGSEAENLTKIRNQLEREKMEVEGKAERAQADLLSLQDKQMTMEKELRRQKEDSEAELRAQKNKYEASIEYMKQEHNLTLAKSQDRLADLELQVGQLKQSLENNEQLRQSQLRDQEQAFQQDKIHLENLHDKKVRSLQKEMDQQEQDHQKKTRKLEQSLREKDEECRHLVDVHKQQSSQAESGLEEFKVQVERNSAKIYGDMKQQMEKVEQDLARSKQLREKQAKENQRLLEEERYQHHKQVSELKLQLEQQRASLLRDFHVEKEVWQSDREQEVEALREALSGQINVNETKAKSRLEKDSQLIAGLESEVQSLREELVQANSLRKQQLVELGLLREEEKHKMKREHETEMSRTCSESEQQRLDLEKKHSVDIENMIEKTNARLKDIEKEYGSRAEKNNQTISDQQQTISDLKNRINRLQEEAEKQVTTATNRLDEEKKRLKKHHAAMVMNIQQELETEKSKSRQLERQNQFHEQDSDEKLTLVRAQYEEKLRGLIPVTVRQELEDTISSLKQQISALQQRAAVLQEDLEVHSCPGSDKLMLSTGSLHVQHLGNHLGGSSNTIASSVKSLS